VITLINFSHPITDEQVTDLQGVLGDVVDVVDVSVQVDMEMSFDSQADGVLDAVGLSAKDWQTKSILVNPCGLSAMWSILLAKLHGKMGYFPTVMRLKSDGGTVRKFVVAEIVGLQRIRDEARRTR